MEPEPDLAGRSQFGEFGEDGVDGAHDGFVGIKAYLAILFSPHEAHGQTAAQFSACGLVANSALEPRTQDVQFGFRHNAL